MIKRCKLKQMAALALAAFLALVSTACSRQGQNQQDILSQKITESGRTQLTVLVKYAFTINAFEKAVEEKFPQIDLVQVGNYTRDRGLVEYERRLEHDDLPDLVMTWPLEVGKEYWADRLIDLSGMPFTSRYNVSMLNDITKDGALYYLPGPAQVRGIVYNKTLFQEQGFEVPTDFDGFLALCQKIEATGIRSLQLGFGNEEVLDTAFIGYSYGDCYSAPSDAQWIETYNGGIGSFGDQFSPALDTFERMMDAGIWKKSDLELTYAQREKMLFTRQCAMVEDSVLMARMGYSLTGTTDEFALMPFFSPGSSDDWARLYMVCYIGMNKHLQEPGNKTKYEYALELMDYISTPEGQEALTADTGAMYSSLTDVPAPNIEEIADLLPALEHGRYAIFPELKNAQSALRKGLAGMLEGSVSREELIESVDEQNKHPAASQTDQVIGIAAADFTMMETGNFVTDAMRAASGTEIALFMDNGKDGRYNGKGISGRFYEGQQTEEDVLRILPDLKHDEAGVLQVVTMTGQSLLDTLEYAISVDNNNTGWFYYFSGLRMEFDPTAEPGQRIQKITDEQGKTIDPGQIYSIAIMDGSVSKELILSCEDHDLLISDLLIDTIRQSQTIAPSGDARFQIAASRK